MNIELYMFISAKETLEGSIKKWMIMDYPRVCMCGWGVGRLCRWRMKMNEILYLLYISKLFIFTFKFFDYLFNFFNQKKSARASKG